MASSYELCTSDGTRELIATVSEENWAKVVKLLWKSRGMKELHDSTEEPTAATSEGNKDNVARLLWYTRRKKMLHDWAVDEAFKKAPTKTVRKFVTLCSRDQLHFALEHLLARGLWTVVKIVLDKGIGDHDVLWVVDEAFWQADETTFIEYIFPYCADEQLLSVLTNLLIRGFWRGAFQVLVKIKQNLQLNVFQAFTKATQFTGDQHLFEHMVIECPSELASHLLGKLVYQGLWEAAGKILGEQFQTLPDHATATTCILASEDGCIPHLLPESESILLVFVRHFMWEHAVEVLKETAYSQQDLGNQFVQNISDNLLDDKLDSELTSGVTRLLWQIVDKLMQELFSEAGHIWATEEASKYTAVHYISKYILQHYAEDQMDALPMLFVTKRLWEVVGKVLQRVIIDQQSEWFLKEASQCASDPDLCDYIFPQCTDIQLDRLLKHLATQGRLNVVNTALMCGVSDKRLVDAYIKQASSMEFIHFVLPLCADSWMDSVLAQLVTRGLWEAADNVLCRGVDEEKHRWTVEEGSKHATSNDFIQHVLPHCTDDQLGDVLKHLVARGLWQAVDIVLYRAVSEEEHRWAVEEGSKTAKYKGFVKHVLPHCASNQLDSVLTNLVTQNLWNAVEKVLQQGVSNERQRWAVEEGSKRCTNDGFLQYLFPRCEDDQLDSVLKNLVTRRLWKAVDKMLQRGVSEHAYRWAMEAASVKARPDSFKKYVLPNCGEEQQHSVITYFVKHEDWKTVSNILDHGISETKAKCETETTSECTETDSFKIYIMPAKYAALLPLLVEYQKWNEVEDVLHEVVTKSLCLWAEKDNCSTHDDITVLWSLVESCRVNVSRAHCLFTHLKARRELKEKIGNISKHLGLKQDLGEVLYTSLLHELCVSLCSAGKEIKSVNEFAEKAVLDIYNTIIACLKSSTSKSVQSIVGQIKNIKAEVKSSLSDLEKCGLGHMNSFLLFLQQFNLYYTSRKGKDDDDILLLMFAILPLCPELQAGALNIMLRQKRWDVIRYARLSYLWEQDRRELLKAAVKQRQWSAVKRWADHTLYDDQRVWALNEALNEKQWDVALLLADHGLTETELMRVHYRLARQADWKFVLQMFERGADVADVKARLERMIDDKRMIKNSANKIFDKYELTSQLEKKIRASDREDLTDACCDCNWPLVLFSLTRIPRQKSMALRTALKQKAWHVVLQLVKLVISVAKRDCLFFCMMRRRKWGVCRALLEQGLSVQVCLDALPHLMEMNQWSLVARVMEHDVDDALRQQVMQRAWERREGSVVWLCIRSLPAPLSLDERKALFQRALTCDIWQVIRPLVEEKDVTGIRHRDTALLEAIEQHQWDVVDHCQRHHADIDMKENSDLTPLQKAACKKDWDAVNELLVRGADPNTFFNRARTTVLHMAIDVKRWDTVKLLIEYHADIHKKGVHWPNMGLLPEFDTPLRYLIDEKQGELIESTLMWCPDQGKVVNISNETPLHAACLSDCWRSLYYLVARGVDPLIETSTDRSILVYAVLNESCPQKMVAECIKLGVTTHLKAVTNDFFFELALESILTFGINPTPSERRAFGFSMTSPFLCAVMLGYPTVTCMLYESGACSNKELYMTYRSLALLIDGPLSEEIRPHNQTAKSAEERFKKFFAYIKKIATTPRRLESICRLVISHCLSLKKTRFGDVYELPLKEKMQKFILFSDLTDPDFGKDQ